MSIRIGNCDDGVEDVSTINNCCAGTGTDNVQAQADAELLFIGRGTCRRQRSWLPPMKMEKCWAPQIACRSPAWHGYQPVSRLGLFSRGHCTSGNEDEICFETGGQRTSDSG